MCPGAQAAPGSKHRVYDARCAILRLLDSRQFVRNQTNSFWPYRPDSRSDRISRIIYHQRLHGRGVGLPPRTPCYMVGLCHELSVCTVWHVGRLAAGSALLAWRRRLSRYFGLAPRICAASFVAFLVGSFLNAYVMSRMKLHSDGGKHFSYRAIASTVVGETGDSLVFFPLALGGVVPWPVIPLLMLNQVVLKTAYEIVVLPITIRVVRALKRHEGEDTYDKGISYSVWKIFDI